MVTEKPSRILLVVLVVVVLAAAGAAAAFVYEVNKPKSATSILTVQVGDNVTVNYIGTFGSGAQQGRVFDTSIYSVATLNLTYPKSLEYESRGAVSAYTPLPVHVGPNAPSGGYTLANQTFSTVVTGFWQGLIGLPGNHSSKIVVPPNLGYGALNTSCVGTSPLSYTFPVLSNVPAASFPSLYPNITATVGTEFTDPTYGWNDSVFSVNSTTVIVQALPSVGWHASPNGIPFTVSALNATTITLTSTLTTANAGQVLGHAASGGLCGGTKFIVSAVDPAAGTFTENFNPEVQGETLIFTVTVVDIYPA
jgi:FKBP-type peptidyl-prolyl cis-trans isomerase 2